MMIYHVIKTDQQRSAPQIHPAAHFVVSQKQRFRTDAIKVCSSKKFNTIPSMSCPFITIRYWIRKTNASSMNATMTCITIYRPHKQWRRIKNSSKHNKLFLHCWHFDFYQRPKRQQCKNNCLCFDVFLIWNVHQPNESVYWKQWSHSGVTLCMTLKMNLSKSELNN